MAKEKEIKNIVEGIEIGDPLILRPVELPLVVKPANGGKWKNEAQARYASILNAYAYKNPKKWEVKKNDVTVTSPKGNSIVKGLISQLIEIGEDPSRLSFYLGGDNGIKYDNKIINK